MTDSYFEYCIKQCEDMDIVSVCDIYKTKAEILKAAQEGFNGSERILGQVHLIRAASSFLQDNGFVCYENLGRDIKRLYDRFMNNIMELKEINSKCIDVDRETMFNVMIDFNWLLSSLYKAFSERSQSKVALLDSSNERDYWFQKAVVEEIYNGALRDKEYSEHFKEAQGFKYSIFTGMIPYKEVNDYLAVAGDSYTGLRQQETYYRTESVDYMALFFGVIATAALAEKIRRAN